MPIQEYISNLSVLQVVLIAIGAFLLCVAVMYLHELITIREREQEAFDPAWMDAEAFEELESDDGHE